MKETYIRGFRVKYEDSAQKGVSYLMYDLNKEQARVFFDQARLRRVSQFEDDLDIDYTLTYNSDYSYTLIRK